jgi:hypothetical protein
MATKERQFTLRDYRTVIREFWLPIVGRKKLTSFEYTLTEAWFNDGTPASWVIRAVEDVRKNATKTLYSIGVIRASLEKIARTQAKLRVGEYRPKPAADNENWREELAEDLDLFAWDADKRDDEETSASLRKLKEELPDLTRRQATDRWQEIVGKFPESNAERNA